MNKPPAWVAASDAIRLLLRDDLDPLRPRAQPLDPDKLWSFMQRITCPVPCIGYVNRTGWHQECQKRAQKAMTALGFDAPEIDPIPEDEDDWNL